MQVPFAFAENRGQADPRVRYIGTGPEFKAWFEDRAVILQRGKTAVRISFQSRRIPNGPPSLIAPEDPTGATANYLRGATPRLWQTGLPLFHTIRYTGVWPGVELSYKAEQSGVKAEYLVAPGVDVNGIRLRFDSAARIERNGALRIPGASGDFIEDKPVLYQSIHGERIEVAGGFREFADGSIGFRTSGYDRGQPLIIDPAILLSGYFGGSSEDTITAVAVDALNNVVVAGWTSSSDLPSIGLQPRKSGGVDAFVAAFYPNGGTLKYCTYIGGSGDDRAFGLAIDTVSNVYITGWTQSTNFPLVGALQPHLKGTRNAFVAKLSAAGNALLYSTYLGGSGLDSGNAIAVDSTNSAVIVGDSTSSNLPVTAGAFQSRLGGVQDAFVAKLTPQGSSLTFLTYLGGNATEHGTCINVVAAGAIFVGGSTWSNNLPVLAAIQPKSGGGQDGFYAKFTSAGVAKFVSYLGGTGGTVGAPEQVNAIYVSTLGYLLLAGTTSSANFPVTPGALQTTFGGENDGFITNIYNGQLFASTFLGGSLNDGITAMTQDFYGNPYVTGFTSSPDFPAQQHTLQIGGGGAMDTFVVKLNNTLSSATFGTLLGGSGNDQANAIAVDSYTSIIVAGQTGSPNFPLAGSLPNYLPSPVSSFITKIRPNFTLGVGYGYQGQMEFTADPWHAPSYPASTSYGIATDLPIAGDWTGSGTKNIGVFRNGTWILDTNGNGILDATDKTVLFGQAGDIPVVGDWRGVGHIALGLFRQGTFILDLSGHLTGIPTGLADATFAWGQGGDVPIVADWNGTGTAKVGIFRNGLWLVDYFGNRTNGVNRSYIYGQSGDLPVVGDWDSSGNPPKIGVYRQGLWILNYDGTNTWLVPGLEEMVLIFGFTGYTPLIF
jgi:Beta-propeller repeat